jgi:hypothetical protein
MLLMLHLVSSGAWIGIDVMVAVLVTTGWFADDVELRSLAYRALASFVVWPMLVFGLACLVTVSCSDWAPSGGWSATGG